MAKAEKTRGTRCPRQQEEGGKGEWKMKIKKNGAGYLVCGADKASLALVAAQAVQIEDADAAVVDA